ncbi:hypothetical protein OY671_010903, partial [Metschnikowia pulcherrima]
DFEDGTDIYWARQQVSERLGGISENLPPGTEGGMAPITTPSGEMFMFTVEGDSLSLAERRSSSDWVIRPALRSVPGVADINALGGVVRAFEVVPDASRMAAAGITSQQSREAISANNRNDGAGRSGEGGEVSSVRSEGNIQNLDDSRAIPVPSDKGRSSRLGDSADVKI